MHRNDPSDPVRNLAYQVTDKINDPSSSLDPEIRAAVHAFLEPYDETIELVKTDDGFADFALRYIDEEHTKLHADSPSEHPYDGDREEPLCLCPDPYCELKRAQLPTDISNASDLTSGKRTFRQSHQGAPLVLDELSDGWRSERATAKQALRVAKIALATEHKPGDILDMADEAADDMPNVDTGALRETTADQPAAGD
jgi:hypothetical protein